MVRAAVRWRALMLALVAVGVALGSATSEALADDNAYPILQDSLLVPGEWQAAPAPPADDVRAVDDTLLTPSNWRAMAFEQIALRAVDDTLLDPFAAVRAFLADPWAGWAKAKASAQCDCECASILVPGDWSN